jgi:hypothetical protein
MKGYARVGPFVNNNNIFDNVHSYKKIKQVVYDENSNKNSSVLKPQINQKIIGLSSASESPSEQIITLYDEIQKVPLNNVVINKKSDFKKIFINPSSLPTDYGFYKLPIEALDYELRFYLEVVKPLLDFEISPHFVRYYDSGFNLGLLDYLEMYNVKDKNNISSINDVKQIIRNIFYMYYQERKRPSINTPFNNDGVSSNDGFNLFEKNNNEKQINKNLEKLFDQVNSTWKTNSKKVKELDKNIIKNLTFNYITLQSIDSNNTKTFFEMLNRYQTGYNNPYVKCFYYIMIFQVAQACFSLWLSKSVQNDLHTGNIWVTVRPENKQKIKYIINDKEYNLYTNICCRIYDFDRSYAEKLGNNPFLAKTDLCLSSKSCNISRNGPRDFLQFLCNVITIISGDPSAKEFLEELYDLIIPKDNTNLKEYFVKDNKYNERCLLAYGKTPIPDNKLQEFNSYPVIIDKIFNHINYINSTIAPVKPENITNNELGYVLPAIFSSNDPNLNKIYTAREKDFNDIGEYIFQPCCE